ncbi:hypothetical protein CRM22_004126 [Opisthorchis felineus]|uniref:Uncharacterized protein n=1 Tax=Opisthorchis felineus TaxID=147828 RepID=A0A4S2M408_OPIFE|nr:hypothetical protein CRM22_004126 [Opisthorchis felineus]
MNNEELTWLAVRSLWVQTVSHNQLSALDLEETLFRASKLFLVHFLLKQSQNLSEVRRLFIGKRLNRNGSLEKPFWNPPTQLHLGQRTVYGPQKQTGPWKNCIVSAPREILTNAKLLLLPKVGPTICGPSLVRRSDISLHEIYSFRPSLYPHLPYYPIPNLSQSRSFQDGSS